jgi:hypothetical protein
MLNLIGLITKLQAATLQPPTGARVRIRSVIKLVELNFSSVFRLPLLLS